MHPIIPILFLLVPLVSVLAVQVLKYKVPHLHGRLFGPKVACWYPERGWVKYYGAWNAEQGRYVLVPYGGQAAATPPPASARQSDERDLVSTGDVSGLKRKLLALIDQRDGELAELYESGKPEKVIAEDEQEIMERYGRLMEQA